MIVKQIWTIMKTILNEAYVHSQLRIILKTEIFFRMINV